LASRLGLPLDRLRDVQPLFESPTPQGMFSRWHAVEFHGNQLPHVKIYLNPLVHGPDGAGTTIEEALRRLALPESSLDAVKAVTARGQQDELKYFSLDLSRGDAARVKVYVRHHEVSGLELEHALRHSRRYTPGRAAAFCRTMANGAERYCGRPVFSCLAWSADDPRPSATVYFPVASYVRDDSDANERTLRYLREFGIGTTAYERAISAFATRPLESGVGMLSYVSTKIERGADRVTVYLNPELYQVRAPGIRAA
jgi:DMATS type aromatic prenyltransferase